MIRARLVASAALCLLATAPLSAQDGREALIRSLEREPAVSFEGIQRTEVTSGGKTRRAAQIVKRRAPDKLRIEYLEPARLKGELVIDDGQHLRRSISSLKVIEEGPSRLQRAQQRQSSRIRALRAGKTPVSFVRDDTLLGRRVTVVSILPARPNRPVRTLWLDQLTGVALRVEEKGPGDRTSVTTFERISFNPVLGDAEFQLPVPAGVTVVPEQLGRPISPQRAEAIARRLWGGLPTPTLLPPGYVLTSAHQLSFHQRPVIALRYTRGRDDLSLFVSTAAGEPFSAPMRPRLNVVQRPVGGVLVTLVGSLPPPQLERIAASLQHPAESTRLQSSPATHSHAR